MPSLVSLTVERLKIDGCHVAAVLVDPAVVEPVDPFQGRDLDLLEGVPRAAGLDQLGLVEPVDRLRESVVIALTG